MKKQLLLCLVPALLLAGCKDKKKEPATRVSPEATVSTSTSDPWTEEGTTKFNLNPAEAGSVYLDEEGETAVYFYFYAYEMDLDGDGQYDYYWDFMMSFFNCTTNPIVYEMRKTYIRNGLTGEKLTADFYASDDPDHQRPNTISVPADGEFFDAELYCRVPGNDPRVVDCFHTILNEFEFTIDLTGYFDDYFED